MIYLYSGTPGSGKSLHATADVKKKLRSGGNVIANFPIKIEKIHGCKGKFYYVPDEELTVDYLLRFALEHHVKGKEKQTLIVIDEASRLFNPRDFARPDRMQWNKFMAMHRHLGYSMILVSQSDRLLDKQIRYQIEFDVKHRAANNFKTFGWFLGLLHIKFFVAVFYWYAVHGEKDHTELIRFNRGLAELYDSYALFDYGKVNEIAAAGRQGRRAQVWGAGGPSSAPPVPAAASAATEPPLTAEQIAQELAVSDVTPDLYHGGNSPQTE
jgi:zona occludens toxin (predicted ATPase)